MQHIIHQILGNKIPRGATSISTHGNTITFCVGKTGELIDSILTETEKK